jgi:transcription initiation factor TFIIIB Brf1 subunit/transcription initiation factor TFIIB
MKRKADKAFSSNSSSPDTQTRPPKERKIIIRPKHQLDGLPESSCRNCLGRVEENAHEGFMICQQCGLVAGDRLICTESEWRTFADEKGEGGSKGDPNRVGGFENPLLAQFGLSTMINGDGKDNLHRVQAQQGLEAQQRALMEDFRELEKWASKHDLPQAVCHRAQTLYIGLRQQPQFKSCPRAVLSAVCMFIVAREAGTARFLSEIATIQGLEQKQIKRLYKRVADLHKRNPEIRKLFKSTAYKGNEINLIARYLSETGLDAPRRLKLEMLTTEIVKNIHKNHLFEGRNPSTVLGLAFWLASERLQVTELTLAKIGVLVGRRPSTLSAVRKTIADESLL